MNGRQFDSSRIEFPYGEKNAIDLGGVWGLTMHRERHGRFRTSTINSQGTYNAFPRRGAAHSTLVCTAAAGHGQSTSRNFPSFRDVREWIDSVPIATNVLRFTTAYYSLLANKTSNIKFIFAIAWKYTLGIARYAHNSCSSLVQCIKHLCFTIIIFTSIILNYE